LFDRHLELSYESEAPDDFDGVKVVLKEAGAAGQADR
jgi:hypothetical protein